MIMTMIFITTVITPPLDVLRQPPKSRFSCWWQGHWHTMPVQWWWWWWYWMWDATKKFKRYRYWYFFPVPNIFDTGTCFGTYVFQYRLRDHQKNILVPVAIRYRYPLLIPKFRRRKTVSVSNFADTGNETFSGTKLFRYRLRYHQKNKKSWYRYRYPL